MKYYSIQLLQLKTYLRSVVLSDFQTTVMYTMCVLCIYMHTCVSSYLAWHIYGGQRIISAFSSNSCPWGRAFYLSALHVEDKQAYRLLWTLLSVSAIPWVYWGYKYTLLRPAFQDEFWYLKSESHAFTSKILITQSSTQGRGSFMIIKYGNIFL